MQPRASSIVCATHFSALRCYLLQHFLYDITNSTEQTWRPLSLCPSDHLSAPRSLYKRPLTLVALHTAVNNASLSKDCSSQYYSKTLGVEDQFVLRHTPGRYRFPSIHEPCFACFSLQSASFSHARTNHVETFPIRTGKALQT